MKLITIAACLAAAVAIVVAIIAENSVSSLRAQLGQTSQRFPLVCSENLTSQGTTREIFYPCRAATRTGYPQ